MNATATTILSLILLSAIDRETYLLATGKPIDAEVIQLDGERVRMRVFVGGGSLERWFQLSEFRAHSAYRILREVAKPDDVAARLRLAEFAANNGLVSPAKRELELARKLSKNKVLGTPIERLIDEKAARGLERMFREALAKKQFGAARKYLSAILIRHSAARSASEKTALIELLESKSKEAADAKVRAKTDRARATDSKRRQVRLREIRKYMDAAASANRRGLLDSKHFANAHSYFTKAVRYYESAVKRAKSLESKNVVDDILRGEAKRLRIAAEEALKNSLLNSGSLCLVRGKFNTAMGHVNRVLALEAGNARALAMRARIEIAANQWGYGY